MQISYAPAGSGPNAGGIGWVDFGAVTFTPGAAAVPVTGTMTDGTVVNFDINVTNDAGVSANFQALQPPTWAGTFFANPANPGGYNGVVGNIALTSNTAGIGTNTAHLTNISLTDSLGNPITNYTAIVADAESTDFSEVMIWVSNGSGWEQFALLGNTVAPTLTGLGTDTVSLTGAQAGVIHENYVLTTNSPTQLDLSTQSTVANARLGFAVAFVVTKVEIQKEVQGRLDPADQFTLDITGNYPSTATTTGSANGIQAERAFSYGLPNQPYTVNEAMAPGSVNPLTAYTQTVTATNLSPGQTVPPVGALPQTVTPVLGDVIVYTVTNAISSPTAVKSVDPAFADIGDLLTYSVEVTNPNAGILSGVSLTDAIPNGTTFVSGSLTATNATVVGSNPSGGLILNNIPANTTATVSWQVTIGEVVPNPNPILNTATLTDPTGATITTNEVSTTVNYADLTAPDSFVKSVDLTFAEPGDLLTYTINLTNTGNVAADNVVITDAIPAGTTFVVGSLTGATGTPPTLNVASIPAGATATVAFQVLVGDMVSTPNPIPNIADLTYEYTVDPADPNGASGGGQSNAVLTQINTADLIITKTVDRASAQRGDLLTYTLVLENTGNVPANNVVITDAVPNGTTFIAGSVFGAVGALPTLTLANPIPAGGTATVVFQVQVGDTVPIPNPVPNSATADFTYTVDPANPNGVSGSSDSNIVTTQVNFALVSATKSVDKTFLQPGEVVTYTLTLENIGNAVANNVVITDAIPTGTAFVVGSVMGASGTPPTLTLNAPIAAGSTAMVTYQVKVGNNLPNPNPMLNSFSAEYTYTVDPANPNGATRSATSNITSSQVNTAKLVMIKRADKDIAYLDDIITYQVAVTNIGNVSANSVVLSDAIPMGTVLVPNSLTTSVPFTGTLPSLTLTNPIAPGQTITLSYQIRVTEIPNPNPIVNTIAANYLYTVDPVDPDGASAAATSNSVATLVFRNNLGQQVFDLIQSVALEQAAMAAIANAEGAKIQAMVARGEVTAQQLLCLNKSIADMLDTLSMLEAVLKQKLNLVNCQINGTGC